MQAKQLLPSPWPLCLQFVLATELLTLRSSTNSLKSPPHSPGIIFFFFFFYFFLKINKNKSWHHSQFPGWPYHLHHAYSLTISVGELNLHLQAAPKQRESCPPALALAALPAPRIQFPSSLESKIDLTCSVLFPKMGKTVATSSLTLSILIGKQFPKEIPPSP